MTEDEARKLAQRLIDTWPNGTKAYVWRDLVANLDGGTAAGAYRQLASDAERTPTPGMFMAQYKALKRRDDPSTFSGPRWTGNEISLDEYLRRLTARADNGNIDAMDELDNWSRWLTPKERK